MAPLQNATEELTDEPACSIERSLEVLGERWTFLVLRQLFLGQTRFSELRESLGIAPNLLSARLRTLTEAGVVETAPYQEIGARQRQSYHLTKAGSELWVVLMGLQQWGDVHRPRPAGPSAVRRSKTTGQAVRVAFVDEDGVEVPVDEVEIIAQ
ncbi:helix-turn-helix domain-containing protein [Amycolatopsis sp. DSM 110486]|uniref:winged helix-turn-helix transcriptional regulator n=1 Tax=Amycolatopsis sp. DSM 110486 TaxID=2865832 RepID=UPI001C6A8519|nr:helix-turn-helix domain-containing protein [Amycolatopsis sp. DSM 110486]QYN25617.1 helix-turn-helix transcriptional regulator [Amycolatopsis sp. DSM 110486]